MRSTGLQPVIVTADLARARHFYEQLLDATVVRVYPSEDEPFFVGLKAGPTEFGLVHNADAASGDGGRVLLDIGIESVNDALPLVEQLGGTVKGPASDMPWGFRVAHVLDPDGNPINLSEQL